ncbi:hypothetical protein ACFL4W_04460, partial [Planctomycetota bacterium]
GLKPELDALLREKGDWQGLLRLWPKPEGFENIKALAMHLTYLKLSEKQEDLSRIVKEITALPPDPERGVRYARILAAVGYCEASYDVLIKNKRHQPAFLLAAARFDIDRIKGLLQTGEMELEEPFHVINFYLNVLEWLGSHHSRKWAGSVIEKSSQLPPALFEAEFNSMQEEIARKHFLEFAASQHVDEEVKVLPAVLPGYPEDISGFWWRYFARKSKWKDSDQVIQRTQECLSGKLSDDDIRKLLNDTESVKGDHPTQYRRNYAAASKLWAGLGDMEKSGHYAWESLNKKHLAINGPYASRIIYESSLYQKALPTLTEICGERPGNAQMLFLRGICLKRTGQQEEGEKQVEQALEITLADRPVREYIADMAKALNLKDLSREQYELILRTGKVNYYDADYRSHEVVPRSADKLSRLLAEPFNLKTPSLQDIQTAVLYKTRYLVSQTPTMGKTPLGLLNELYVLHKYKAGAHILEGKIREGMKEIRYCLNLKPMDIGVAVFVIPLLDEKGYVKEANKLFRDTYENCKKKLKVFPQSPIIKQEIIALCLQAHRNLEEALTLALRIAEARPFLPDGLKYLAEACFRLEKRTEALQVVQRIIKINPWDSWALRMEKRYKSDSFPKRSKRVFYE